jgi:signal transduction histidine kinase
MNEEKKYTILYVDDEESNLRIFKNTFRHDYNIVTATSGKEGLEVLDNESIDLILTDQRMPGMSGIDFLKRAIDKYPDLNRILVTAYTDYDILREAVNELKIFQYVEKPWDEGDVKATINNALEIHRLKLENQQLTTSLISNNDELRRMNEELNEEIDKHKQTQLELIREKEYAENCNLLKTAFLANMSHEIRTPMNSIMGFLDLIDNNNLPNDTKREYMMIVQKSCIQLLHIIDDIIEISKIETSNVEIKKEVFIVNELLNRIVSNMAPLAKSIDFELTGLSKIHNIEICSDAAKLEKVLVSILGNAFKFTPHGKVEFGVVAHSHETLFFVKDSGIGISKENHEIVFQRFSQVENALTRKFGGNGLGLAIAKAYVEKMGGKIWVESELDKGATFFFTIPARIKN